MAAAPHPGLPVEANGGKGHPAWFWVAPVGQRKRKDILSHLPPLR